MRRLSVGWVALAALCWGLSGGIAAILLNAGWDALVVSFYRGAIGLLCVLPWLACRPSGSGISNRRLWGWSLLAGFGVAGNFVFYFLSVAAGGIAIAATLMYCAPVFVYLVSFSLGMERPTLLKGVAIAMVMLGIGLLTQVYEVGSTRVSPWAVAAGLLAGLSYAVFIFGFKLATPHGSPQAVLTIAFTVLVCLLFGFGDGERILAVVGSPQWPLFAVLGVLGAGLSFFLYVAGLNETPPAVASIVAMIEPVTASLFGVVLLHESLEPKQFIGMGFIVVAATALSAFAGAPVKARKWAEPSTD